MVNCASVLSSSERPGLSVQRASKDVPWTTVMHRCCCLLKSYHPGEVSALGSANIVSAGKETDIRCDGLSNVRRRFVIRLVGGGEVRCDIAFITRRKQ